MVCWAKPHCANFLWDEHADVNADATEPHSPLPHHIKYTHFWTLPKHTVWVAAAAGFRSSWVGTVGDHPRLSTSISIFSVDSYNRVYQNHTVWGVNVHLQFTAQGPH
jgi:hypothetical protein